MSKPTTIKPRKKRLSSTERRAEFITKAIEFFAEAGFESSTRELAKHLGVTQPLLYRYFPSKDDLIKEVYQTVYLNRWQEEWDTLLCDRKRPLRERLQSFYEAYTDAIFNREWLRIFLFSGLKGVEINRWYIGLVKERILERIITEYRVESGDLSGQVPSDEELELAWVMHGGIFYYGIRKHIYESVVMEDKSRMISDALDVFLKGLATSINPSSK
ncbi:MAG: TetR/AcrR family transcriptional regulator [Rhizobiaceae bacterium]